jgi:type I restriction enzyme S subunit
MRKWPPKTIGDLVTLQRGIDLPAADRKPGSVPIMGSFGVTGRHNEAACTGPGVTVGRSGASAGVVCYIEKDFWPLNTCLYVRDFKGNHPRFAYYLLKTFDLASLNSGSAQPSLNRNFVHPVPAAFPEPPEQAAIATVLGALDDKIELNRRMNETLEKTARAIFKDWFVDFGPTRAKMEGRAPYLVPDVWSLFPDHLDDDGKPAGWVASTIGEEVDVVGGSTPSTKDPRFWGGDTAWTTPKDLSSLSTPVLLSTERQITDAGLSQIGSGLLPVGTVLLSSRAPIGYLAIAQIPTAINQGFIAMICQKRLLNVFVWLWTQANMDTVLQNANGSTFQEISKASFRPIPVTVASPATLRIFDETVRPLFDRIVSNEKETRSIAEMRDFLLPKLMSGEVSVREAE